MATTSSGVDPSPLNSLPGLLGAAVFEQIPDGRFAGIGCVPEWLPVDADPANLSEQFPIVDLFLPEFEAVWQQAEDSRCESDIWTESDPRGGEQYVQALASNAGGRRLLIIRALPQEMYTRQQLAHDLELANERAERATRAKSDFLAVMSHEIRTPLNAIIGMADVLASTPLTPEQKKCVEVFQRNGVNLLNLINDILDVSKVEAGKLELEQVNFELRDVIARAFEVIEIRATQKGLQLLREVSPDVPAYFVGDPNRLRQVMINLLGNSLKFTEHGSLTVRVEWDGQPGYLRFAVADTGIGIPQDKLGRIFESFSQADSSTTRKYGGTGLGLNISKRIVERMGGRIWVESNPGEGSTFLFTANLPLGEPPKLQPVSPVSSTLTSSTHTLRVLLVDDSEDNRFLFVSYLKNTPCTVDLAENGEQAVERFRQAQYDVVLMDVEMPIMDGYTATREIRKLEAAGNIAATPVLALTAHAMADMADKAREAGFTGHLIKPIRRATLLDALASYAKQPPQQNAVPQSTNVVTNMVKVDPDMEDIVPGYLEKRRAEVAKYQTALAGGDFDAIRMLGHKMKGTGGGYGFPMLTEIGGKIEDQALAHDAEGLRGKIEEFARYVNSVKLEFRQ
jgi:signal transduction histidine kinase/DNA-binding response OmpR family regulator